jgi:hypothetical protein
MAHFAELDENNIVKQVVVVHNNELLDGNGKESEQKGIDFCVAHFGGRWVQTSYSEAFRKNYAGNGYSYDETNDCFISPSPFPSWKLNNTSFKWEAPKPLPDLNNLYDWDETTVNWVKVELPALDNPEA